MNDVKYAKGIIAILAVLTIVSFSFALFLVQENRGFEARLNKIESEINEQKTPKPMLVK
jgi:hypothetical protein